MQGRERYGSEIIGPVSQNAQWLAKAGAGDDLASFTIDWQNQQAIGSQGKQSGKWTPRANQHGHPKIAIRFGWHECRECPARPLCTRSATAPRILAVRTQAECEVLQSARQLQQTEAFRARYGQRSGIEGTHAQAVRSLGLRRTRSFGLPRTALSHVCTAAAINLIRLDAFLEGKKTAKTRVSRFAALAPAELAS